MTAISELGKLGTELAEIIKRDKQIREAMKPLILEAAADGVPQVEIVRQSGYTRETIRKMLLPAPQAEAAEEARRKRRRKTGDE